jgi:hypothetical protein
MRPTFPLHKGSAEDTLGLAGGLILTPASSALDLSNGQWVDLIPPH